MPRKQCGKKCLALRADKALDRAAMPYPMLDVAKIKPSIEPAQGVSLVVPKQSSKIKVKVAKRK